MRLQEYDYAQAGAYFVTICVQDRLCLFGEVSAGLLVSNQYGVLVAQAWNDLPNHYPHVILDQFVVMPNHIHGIIILTDVGAGLQPVGAGLRPVGAGLKPAPTPAGPNPAPPKRHGLPEIVRALKTFSARRINEIRQTPGISVWQRNYYEHVIRNETDYTRIAEYIIDNPRRWSEDSLHPENAPVVDRSVVGAAFKPHRGTPDIAVGAANTQATAVGAALEPVGAGLKPAPTKPEPSNPPSTQTAAIPRDDDGDRDG